MSRELRSERLTLRPVTPRDVERLREIRCSPWVSRWWGDGDDEAGWPLSETDVDSYAIWRDGEIVGFAQCYEILDPSVRYAGIDIFIAESHSGHGLGPEAIRRLVAHLVEDKGHHRVIIDPAVDNQRAISCYEACGFCRVGVMKSYERDHEGSGWHDALLMELVTPQ